MKISLTVNGRMRELEVDPLARLLDLLRDDLGLTGAKEGCGEGECGACAVLLDGRLVDSCLVPAFQAHGRSVTTIEGMGDESDPDPVQAAFVAEGAVQCGFCIPGMEMAARALLNDNPDPDRDAIRRGLSGNLCRCTGYEKIIRAVEVAAASQNNEPDVDRTPRDSGSDADAVAGTVAPEPDASDSARIIAPRTLAGALAAMAEAGPRARAVAGATDFTVETRSGIPLPEAVIDLSGVAELHGVTEDGDVLVVGAGCTIAELAFDSLIGRRAPALAAAAMRLGAPAIRNRATLGGNLATCSPCADTAPPLIALEAEIELASAAGMRRVPAESFAPRYRDPDLRPDELIVAARIPAQPEGVRQAFFKVGARRAQAIAKVNLACRASLGRDGRLRDVRLAAGSVAPTVLLLRETMAWLEGRDLAADPEGVAAAAAVSAAAEVSPIDDVRSSRLYRREVAGNLVARFLRDLAT